MIFDAASACYVSVASAPIAVSAKLDRQGAAMPDTNTAAAASFQNADAYEHIMGRWSRRLAPLLIRFGGLSDGDRILDVGCGTGSLTFTVPEIANT
jgi:2-polyprenyl-3-methyl-5-hydroxy-6-metoxy-1,4-benzoquinol methylase